MALSGQFYGTTNHSKIKPCISWSAKQSTAGNYSLVTAQLQYVCSDYTGSYTGTWNGTLTINGESLSGSLQMQLQDGKTVVALTHQVTVYHDDNGNKTITISATGGMGTASGVPLQTTAISADVTLDTIDRPSEISATAGNIEEMSVITVQKSSSSFTHSLCYRFGAMSGYISSAGAIVEKEEIFSGTVVKFAIPASFYSQIPNSAAGTCTITCNTYKGATLVGYRTAGFTVTAEKSKCLPEVSLAVTDTNSDTVALTGDSRILVLNASNALCELTVAGKNGASVTKTTLLGKTVGKTTTLSPVQTGNLTYSATDSRGYCTEKTYIAKTVSYLRPTLNVSVKRESPTADTAVLKVTGQCYHGSFGAVENSLYLQVYVGKTAVFEDYVTLNEDNTYQLSVALTGVSYQKSYDIQVVGADKLYTVQKAVTLFADVPVFDWGETDFRFNVPVYIPKLYVGEIVYAQPTQEQ